LLQSDDVLSRSEVYITTTNQPYIRLTEIMSILKVQTQLHVSVT